MQSWHFCIPLQQKKTKIMTERSKTYRLTSIEEPTDDMPLELMEDVAEAAKESSAKAEVEKRRRLSEVALIIKKNRLQRELAANV